MPFDLVWMRPPDLEPPYIAQILMPRLRIKRKKWSSWSPEPYRLPKVRLHAVRWYSRSGSSLAVRWTLAAGLSV
jgi:hypothetical protein